MYSTHLAGYGKICFIVNEIWSFFFSLIIVLAYKKLNTIVYCAVKTVEAESQGTGYTINKNCQVINKMCIIIYKPCAQIFLKIILSIDFFISFQKT